MSDDPTVKICKYIITGIVLVIVSGVGSCQSTNYQVRKMVEAGAHPIHAACAIDANRSCGGLEIVELEKLRGGR